MADTKLDRLTRRHKYWMQERQEREYAAAQLKKAPRTIEEEVSGREDRDAKVRVLEFEAALCHKLEEEMSFCLEAP